jgi:signal transduction histidine kinase
VQFDEQLPAGEVIAIGAPGIFTRNVLANLLSNAVKFAPPHTGVTLAVQRRPGEVGLRITDRGTGISPETLAALESSGPLTSEVGTAGERGTGFGLRITRDFLAAMGGSLSFATPQDGAGTIVTVWLREPTP